MVGPLSDDEGYGPVAWSLHGVRSPIHLACVSLHCALVWPRATLGSVDSCIVFRKESTVMPRLSLRYPILLLVAVLALILGGIGTISASAGASPASVSTALLDRFGYSQEGQTHSDSGVGADAVARQAIDCVPSKSGSYSLCCYYNTFFTVCWVETGAPASSAHLKPEHLNPSSSVMTSTPMAFSNQPFTPHSQL